MFELNDAPQNCVQTLNDALVDQVEELSQYQRAFVELGAVELIRAVKRLLDAVVQDNLSQWANESIVGLIFNVILKLSEFDLVKIIDVKIAVLPKAMKWWHPHPVLSASPAISP